MIMRFALTLYLLLYLLPLPASAAQDNQLHDAITTQQDQAEDRQDEIQNLESREQNLKRELARVEVQVKAMAKKIAIQEESLVEIEAQEARVRATYLELQAWRKSLVAELNQLLFTLWPIHAGRRSDQLQGLDTWREIDRCFTWLAAIYRATDEHLKEAIQTTKLMAKNLAQQAQLAQEAATRLQEINTAKDKLLKKHLNLLALIRRTHTQRTDLEKELRSILSVIKELNYKLSSQRTKHFADNRKLLPWPAEGWIFSTFAPNSNPPRRGIALTTAESAKVKSVFWGKVVHADILRGFGQVVIVYHGNDYYSVYAYLAQSLVSPGQEVEKDEPLGVVGFNPKTKKPGLYFELRLGSKPINPMKWLYPK